MYLKAKPNFFTATAASVENNTLSVNQNVPAAHIRDATVRKRNTDLHVSALAFQKKTSLTYASLNKTAKITVRKNDVPKI